MRAHVRARQLRPEALSTLGTPRHSPTGQETRSEGRRTHGRSTPSRSSTRSTAEPGEAASRSSVSTRGQSTEREPAVGAILRRSAAATIGHCDTERTAPIALHQLCLIRTGAVVRSDSGDMGCRRSCCSWPSTDRIDAATRAACGAQVPCSCAMPGGYRRASWSIGGRPIVREFGDRLGRARWLDGTGSPSTMTHSKLPRSWTAGTSSPRAAPSRRRS